MKFTKGCFICAWIFFTLALWPIISLVFNVNKTEDVNVTVSLLITFIVSAISSWCAIIGINFLHTAYTTKDDE